MKFSHSTKLARPTLFLEKKNLPKNEINMPEERVLTPGGFRPKSLVHHVERTHGLRSVRSIVHKFEKASNALVEVSGAGLRFAEVPTLGSGWIADAYWNNGTGNSIISFKTTWQVPAAPTTQGNQTIFLSTVFRITEKTLESCSPFCNGDHRRTQEADISGQLQAGMSRLEAMLTTLISSA